MSCIAVTYVTAAARLLRIDWTITHSLNDALKAHDWLEDPITLLVRASIPLMVVVALAPWFLARPYVRSTWRLATAAALASAALGLVVVKVISHLWDRPRPFAAHPGALTLFTPHAADASFPSEHAAATFAIAVAVLALHRRTGLGVLVLAAAISVARVFEGIHYPSDILAGIAIGTLSALLVLGLARPALEAVVRVVQRATDPVVALVRR